MGQVEEKEKFYKVAPTARCEMVSKRETLEADNGDLWSEGGVVVSAGNNGRLFFWSCQGVLLKSTKETMLSSISSLQRVGSNSIFAGNDSTVRSYLLNKDNVLFQREFCGHKGAICDMDYDSKTSFLASASADHTVRLWKLEKIFSSSTKDILQNDDTYFETLRGNTSDVVGVTFLGKNTNTLASANVKGSILVHDFEKLDVVKTLSYHWQMESGNLSYISDRNILISCSSDKSVQVLDLTSMKIVMTFTDHHVGLESLICPNPHSIIVGEGVHFKFDSPHSLFSYDLRSPSSPRTHCAAHRGAITDLEYLEPLDAVCSTGQDQVIKVWNRKDFKWKASMDLKSAKLGMNNAKIAYVENVE